MLYIFVCARRIPLIKCIMPQKELWRVEAPQACPLGVSFAAHRATPDGPQGPGPHGGPPSGLAAACATHGALYARLTRGCGRAVRWSHLRAPFTAPVAVPFGSASDVRVRASAGCSQSAQHFAALALVQHRRPAGGQPLALLSLRRRPAPVSRRLFTDFPATKPAKIHGQNHGNTPFEGPSDVDGAQPC